MKVTSIVAFLHTIDHHITLILSGFFNFSAVEFLLRKLSKYFKKYSDLIFIDVNSVEYKRDQSYKKISSNDFLKLSSILLKYNFQFAISDPIIDRLVNKKRYFINSNNMNTYPCDFFNNIVIDYDGSIYHCNEAMGKKEMVATTIENCLDYIETINSNINYLTDICLKCNLFYYCGGNCGYTNKLHNNGKPLCQYNLILNELKTVFSNYYMIN